jgi:hypothetical protein
MYSVLVSAAVAFLGLAGALIYFRMRKPLAEPDYFMPILTPSESHEARPEPMNGERQLRSRQIRHLDLEQIRSSGL